MTDIQPEALHEARVKLRAAAKEHADSYLHVGALLLHIHDNKLWKGAYGNFVDFLRDEGISRSWGYRCMGIYSHFQLRLDKTKGILPDRLNRIGSLKLSDDLEEHLLHCARDYNPGAFADQIRELRGQMPSDGECEHEPETRCRVCRKLLA